MFLPYVLFVFMYVRINLLIKSLRTGSQAFAFLTLSSLCYFAYYVFGCLQLLCIFPFGML